MTFSEYWDQQIERLQKEEGVSSPLMNLLYDECLKTWMAAMKVTEDIFTKPMIFLTNLTKGEKE